MRKIDISARMIDYLIFVRMFIDEKEIASRYLVSDESRIYDVARKNKLEGKFGFWEIFDDSNEWEEGRDEIKNNAKININ